MNACAVSQSVAAIRDQPEQARTCPVANPRILIAEDDSAVAQDLKDRLESLNYQVPRITSAGREAVVLAQSLMPDLVLMDIQLDGDMDGIQAAQHIHSIGLPVIYVSGYYDGPVLERAKLTQPFGYVRKPYQTDDLRISVELGLQRHQAERERQLLIQRLQEALARVNALSGRFSVCCYCKKIKERTGHWTQIETFIMKNSAATFTHGMCPECFERTKRQIEATEGDGPASGLTILG